METIIFFLLLKVCLCLADSISCENFVFYLAKKGRSSKLGNQAYNWRLKVFLVIIYTGVKYPVTEITEILMKRHSKIF